MITQPLNPLTAYTQNRGLTTKVYVDRHKPVDLKILTCSLGILTISFF
jgi:hypothetical protein